MKFIVVLVGFLICVAANSSSADTALPLSLNAAIRMAVEKNLDVKAELYNPALFEAELNRNRAIYDPMLSVQTNFSDSTAPSASTVLPASSQGQAFLVNTSLSQLLWTGATASAGFNNTFNSNNSKSILNDYWQSSLSVNLTQPLLKNLGREVTEININISRLSKFASLEHFNYLLLKTIAQVRTEYFKLYSFREQLEVRKVSLELARKILSETKARVAAGVLPAMEILNAEFGVTSREKDLIDAEKAVNDQVDVLRLLLQIEQKGDVLTTDLPQRAPFQINEADALKKALNRPDIKEVRRNLEITELQSRVFNNKTKPDLNLTASAGIVGLDQTYQGNIDKVGSLKYPAWSIGFNFAYPFGNNAADNDYRKSRLKTEQTALQIRRLEEGALNDVRNAVRGIIAGYKQMDVADRGRAYAEERLKAFIRKNEVGLATTRDVMDVENDLATAKNNQITAVVNYNNTITLFWQASGELLEREGIRVVEADADKLYKNTR